MIDEIVGLADDEQQEEEEAMVETVTDSPDSGTATVSVPAVNEPRSSTDDLLEQVRVLREKALANIKKARSVRTKAETAVVDAKREQQAAVVAAASLGIEREEIAQVAGVTTSTISSWIRGEVPAE